MKFFCVIRIPKGVEITSVAYCQLLESAFYLGLSDVPLLKRCKLNFHNDNAPSHSAKETQVFISIFELKGDRLMY